MVTKESIDRMIEAHSTWKTHFHLAISAGHHDVNSGSVAADAECPLGKWLHDTPAEEKRGTDYHNVKVLHAEFHREAGKIVEMATSGRRDEALSNLAFAGPYGSASGKLVLALYEWKAKIGATEPFLLHRRETEGLRSRKLTTSSGD